jgi:hypothetical protein
MAPSRPYHVALSFAGEDRAYVAAVARELENMGIRVFYDAYEKARLWGANLYTLLADIYASQAYYAIVFISKHYVRKHWPRRERESMQARSLTEQYEYMLPVRFDKTTLPGLTPNIGYINAHSTHPRELALLTVQKLIDRGFLEDSLRENAFEAITAMNRVAEKVEYPMNSRTKPVSASTTNTKTQIAGATHHRRRQFLDSWIGKPHRIAIKKFSERPSFSQGI